MYICTYTNVHTDTCILVFIWTYWGIYRYVMICEPNVRNMYTKNLYVYNDQ